METIFYIIALSLVALIVTVYLKNSGLPVAGLLVILCGSVLILLKVIPYMVELFNAINDIAASSGLTTDYLALVIKVVCFAYIGEFAGQLCRDAGEAGMAQKVEIGTKMVIMVMAVPLLQTILTTIISVFD